MKIKFNWIISTKSQLNDKLQQENSTRKAVDDVRNIKWFWYFCEYVSTVNSANIYYMRPNDLVEFI